MSKRNKTSFIRRNWKRITPWIIPALVVFAVLVIIVFYNHVSSSADHRIYTSVEEIPHHKVGLLLGTSKYISEGKLNPYYKNRIDAAVLLYQAGKIDYILVSGDNRHESYNEPREMRRSLMAAGIPEEKIFLDYAGFRTLDSVIRSKMVFGQNEITIISQLFHIERALYIALHYEIDAIGFSAADAPDSWSDMTFFREYLARIKLMLDIYLFDTRPKFLGERIEITSLQSKAE
ncbi:MAG: SanA/YdcF family protein [Bacteroidales bacterium]